MISELVLPDWATSFEVQESRFARAYADHSAEQRACLKKNISQLYTWYAAYPYDCQKKYSVFHSGLKSAVWEQHSDWALFVVEDFFLSPGQLLAAVLPAIMGQVREILLVRLKSSDRGWSSSQLVALELAGIENVFEFDWSHIESLMFFLQNWSLNGSTFLLEGPRDNLFARSKSPLNLSSVRKRFKDQFKAGLWVDKTHFGDFDFAQLAWAQPNLAVNVWMDEDFQVQLPAGWMKAVGSWADFLAQGYDVLYIPCFEQAQRALQSSAFLCLGPGQEACWLWPDLEMRNFLNLSICWSD